MNKYNSGLFSWDWKNYSTHIFKGINWNIKFSRTNDTFAKQSNIVGDNGKLYRYKHMIIEANNFLNANKALDLFCGSYCVIDPDGWNISFGNSDFPKLIPVNINERKKYYRDEITVINVDNSTTNKKEYIINQIKLSSSNLHEGAFLASKISRKRHWAYATMKLFFSFKLISPLLVDLDPYVATENLPKFKYYFDQVNGAYSILSAYSAIEELGLQIITKENERSRDRNGVWTDRVKMDLHKRLEENGINPETEYLWTLRGKKTLLEYGRPTKAIDSVPWSGNLVRDEMVNVIDAIADVSWMRSVLAAHKFPNEINKLSPYDVHNAQFLARNLLLLTTKVLKKKYTNRGPIYISPIRKNNG